MVFLSGPRDTRSTADVVAEPDSLADGLDWGPLLCRHAARSTLEADERVLLWRGALPILSVRAPESALQLLVNLDLSRCNAERLPAFAVALARFVESVREAKVGYEVRNVDVDQRLRVAGAPNGGAGWLRAADRVPLRVELDGATELRAPDVPGFFEIVQGDRPLLRAAARFADTREADLRGAGRADLPDLVLRERALRNTREDPLRRLWTCLLIGLLLASWWLLGARA